MNEQECHDLFYQHRHLEGRDFRQRNSGHVFHLEKMDMHAIPLIPYEYEVFCIFRKHATGALHVELLQTVLRIHLYEPLNP